jgi:excinuclease UvrABC ATPase subunit
VGKLLHKEHHSKFWQAIAILHSIYQVKKIAVPAERRKGNGKLIELKGVSGNNLKMFL